MKKTVIKRRKRVPAASTGFPSSPQQPGRMTDPAAAETLVSLGRQERVGSGGSAGEDLDDEGDGPRRKRTRKSRNELSEARRGRTRRSGRLGGDDEDGEDEDEDERMRTRKRSRESMAGGAWDGSAASPEHGNDEARYGFGMPIPPRGAFGGVVSIPGQNGFGLDLPPLTAALGPSLAGLYGGGAPPFPGAPSSYLRSGSVPSRTDSPMGVLGGPGYMLPPPSGLHSGPPPSSSSYFGSLSAGRVSPGNRSRSPGLRGPYDHLALPAVPTLPQLEHHYRELSEQRDRMKEILDRTDAMLAGVRRGIDEARSVGIAQPQPAQSHRAPSPLIPPMQNGTPAPLPSPQAVPLTRERERSATREPVWSVTASPDGSRH